MGSEEEAFPFSNISLRSTETVHAPAKEVRSLAVPSAGVPQPWYRRFLLENRRASLGKAVGWEDIPGHLGTELFSVVPAGVLVLVTWNNVPETQTAFRPGPTRRPWVSLSFPPSSPRPHSSL